MELLNVLGARSIWLLEPRELNPRGKSYISGLIQWLREEYGFTKTPQSALDVNPQGGGLVFNGGSFQTSQGDLIDVDLTIYSDGFVANTQSSTLHTDQFLQQALSSAAEVFHLEYKPGMIRRRAYISELNIRMEPSMSVLNPKLENFAKRLSELFVSEPGVRFEFSSIGFGPDPVLQGGRPGPFTLERKINTPYSERKYYSQAPLETEAHLSLLKELEQLFQPYPTE